MRRLVALVALASWSFTVARADSTPPAARADAAPSPSAHPTCQGSRSSLSVISGAPPEYDRSDGSTRLELIAGETHKGFDFNGVWRCVGFSTELGAYVLLGELQEGAWLPAKEIKFLDEKTFALRSSRYNDTEWLALAVVAGPGLRYLAVIGNQRGPTRLHVYDVRNDRMRELGPAPAPPPLPPDEWHYIEEEHQAWGHWGDFGSDGLIDLDAGIVVFDGPETLHASYGRDTYKSRAKSRKVKRWRLDEK
jgi:hypothetical protein